MTEAPDHAPRDCRVPPRQRFSSKRLRQHQLPRWSLRSEFLQSASPQHHSPRCPPWSKQRRKPLCPPWFNNLRSNNVRSLPRSISLRPQSAQACLPLQWLPPAVPPRDQHCTAKWTRTASRSASRALGFTRRQAARMAPRAADATSARRVKSRSGGRRRSPSCAAATRRLGPPRRQRGSRQGPARPPPSRPRPRPRPPRSPHPEAGEHPPHRPPTSPPQALVGQTSTSKRKRMPRRHHRRSRRRRRSRRLPQ
mmetsp:Transcript_126601/g.328830  ORF Transcript_126601/g.328830 Transcript_126601/m.328830 type:complete len:252 (-) Transcript_126601:130-885(-)